MRIQTYQYVKIKINFMPVFTVFLCKRNYTPKQFFKGHINKKFFIYICRKGNKKQLILFLLVLFKRYGLKKLLFNSPQLANNSFT